MPSTIVPTGSENPKLTKPWSSSSASALALTPSFASAFDGLSHSFGAAVAPGALNGVSAASAAAGAENVAYCSRMDAMNSAIHRNVRLLRVRVLAVTVPRDIRCSSDPRDLESPVATPGLPFLLDPKYRSGLAVGRGC